MNYPKTIYLLTVLAAGGLLFSACSNLKPVADTSRFFALAPLSLATRDASVPEKGLVVGVGRVAIPDYLQSKRIVLHKGNSEMDYSETLYWAERLDKGIQRVLVANLSLLLDSNNLILSAWRRSEVQAEVYVSVERFETDEQGSMVLEARWRITGPGGEKTLLSTVSKIVKRGPSFATDPDGAVSTLSEAVVELSREISSALRTQAFFQGHL